MDYKEKILAEFFKELMKPEPQYGDVMASNEARRLAKRLYKILPSETAITEKMLDKYQEDYPLPYDEMVSLPFIYSWLSQRTVSKGGCEKCGGEMKPSLARLVDRGGAGYKCVQCGYWEERIDQQEADE